MKKQLIGLISLITVAGSIVGLSVNGFASAASNPAAGSSSSTHHDADRRHDRRQRLVARLNQMVRDGVITSAQAQAFRTELTTLHGERKTDLSKTSTKAERTKLDSQLQSWASANNFPLAKLMPTLASQQ